MIDFFELEKLKIIRNMMNIDKLKNTGIKSITKDVIISHDPFEDYCKWKARICNRIDSDEEEDKGGQNA